MVKFEGNLRKEVSLFAYSGVFGRCCRGLLCAGAFGGNVVVSQAGNLQKRFLVSWVRVVGEGISVSLTRKFRKRIFLSEKRVS